MRNSLYRIFDRSVLYICAIFFYLRSKNMNIFNSLYFTEYYHFLHDNSKVIRIEEAVTYLDIYLYYS